MKGRDIIMTGAFARSFPHTPWRGARLLLLGAGLIATSGCVSFGAKPPAQLLAIAPQNVVPAGQTLSGSTDASLFVDLPATPREIATTRVAVRAGPTSYAYVKDAAWIDSPARQFQALLGETIRARLGRLVLDPGQFLARRGQVLEGTLVDFGIDAASRTAVVTYDATLMAPDGQSVTRQRFTASVPVAKIDSMSVAPAIDRAANEVAVAVSDWIRAQGPGSPSAP